MLDGRPEFNTGRDRFDADKWADQVRKQVAAMPQKPSDSDQFIATIRNAADVQAEFMRWLCNELNAGNFLWLEAGGRAVGPLQRAHSNGARRTQLFSPEVRVMMASRICGSVMDNVGQIYAELEATGDVAGMERLHIITDKKQ